MRSMTGYGRASGALAGGTVSVQVSSVNRRSLDLSIKLPSDWDTLESEVGERVRRVAARGKVHVGVEFALGEGRGGVSWSDAAVGEALDRIAALADARHIPFEPTAELLWQVASSLRASRPRRLSADLARPGVIPGARTRRCAGSARCGQRRERHS